MSEIVKDIELLPCPFCGGKAVMESWEMVPFENFMLKTQMGDGIPFSVMTVCHLAEIIQLL